MRSIDVGCHLKCRAWWFPTYQTLKSNSTENHLDSHFNSDFILVFDGSSLPDKSVLECSPRKASLRPEKRGMASAAFAFSWNSCYYSPLGHGQICVREQPSDCTAPGLENCKYSFMSSQQSFLKILVLIPPPMPLGILYTKYYITHFQTQQSMLPTRYSSVLPISRIDLTPADTTAIGVRPSSVKSALTSRAVKGQAAAVWVILLYSKLM